MVVNEVSGGGVGSLGIGLSFGLAVMAAIYSIGHLSGAHINPAVTVAFALTRHFPWRLVPGYVVAQLAGACAAGAAHLALFGNVSSLGATVPSGSAQQAVVLEVVLTLFLMFVVSAVATDVRAVGGAAAIAIGEYVALAATFAGPIAGPIAGASMNPARSFGPALMSGTWTAHWAYWIGPLAGARQKVAFAATESAEALTCYLAASHAGLVFVPMNTAWGPLMKPRHDVCDP